MRIEDIARMAHEANKMYCEKIGDNSQVHWTDAPDWQKESAIKGVKFRIDNPDAPPSVQHKEWMDAKTAEGWKYGEVKDAEKKEHPCLVAYDELPDEQKVKDSLFISVVEAMGKIL